MNKTNKLNACLFNHLSAGIFGGINVSQIAKQEEAGKKSLTKENRLYHKNINY